MANMGKQAEKPRYTLLQEANSHERYFFLYHRLGIQSNILISARYDAGGQRLTRELVIPALRTVLQAHPRLCIVPVIRPAEKKGCHALHLAVLHDIDLDACIEWTDDAPHSSEEEARRVYERVHNEWDFLADEPEKPYFKLVIGPTDVVFVVNHMICDGASGYIFHREFLAALNDVAASQDPSTAKLPAKNIFHRDPASTVLPLEVAVAAEEQIRQGKPWKSRMSELIVDTIFWFFAHTFLSRFFLFGHITEQPRIREATAVATPKDRVITGVEVARLPASLMKSTLASCRANGTTFTALIMAMLMTTMAVDYSPKALFGGIEITFDVRGIFPKAGEGARSRAGAIFNCATGRGQASRMSRFRRVVRSDGSLDHDQLWKLAREYKQWINWVMPRGIRAMLVNDGLGTDLEESIVKTMPIINAYCSDIQRISNLGAFSPAMPGQEDMEEQGPWKITDVQFSMAPSSGGQGSRGLIFSISGLKGADTTIIAEYDKRNMEAKVARDVLDATVARLVALAGWFG